MRGGQVSEKLSWEPPEEFDEYRLVECLGVGSMGKVYLAHDRLLDRAVAIKFLTSMTTVNARERFVIEARAAARIVHPNVMATHRVGELEGHPFLVTEYIRGKNLSDLPLPLPSSQVLDLAVGLARGLATAHRQGVLHRDIKLANAILQEDTGEVKLVDFSLAKIESAPEFALSDEDDYVPEPPDDDEEVSDEEASDEDADDEDADDDSLESAEDGDDEAPIDVHEQALRELDQAVRSGGDASFDETISVDEMRAFQMSQTARKPGAKVSDASAVVDSIKPRTESARSRLLESAAKIEGTWRSGASMLTQVGALVGTPHYMAPELWNAEPATRETDVYALGVLLFILCVGKPPHAAFSPLELALTVREHDMLPVREFAPDVDPKLAAVIDRCLKRDPAERFRSGDELRNALERVGESGRVIETAVAEPYRGLRAFQAEHRDLFFGRSTEIRMVVDRLRSESFVLVAGDSGVGKSSLCRAGVAPRIAEGAIEPRRKWSYATMIPGRRPLQTLLSMLVSHFELNSEAILPLIETKPDTLGWLIHKKLGHTQGKLLIIDQFEELVTISDAEEAAKVGQILLQFAVGIPGVRLMATVRGDFLTRAATVPSIGDELSRAIYLLRPLTRDGIREAIVGPAETHGVRFESEELIKELVQAGLEGSLPMLQFALSELWSVSDRAAGVITTADLRKIGGVTGALARHADGLLTSLLPTQRRAARSLLMRLVTIDDTRASLTEEELVHDDDARQALEAMVRGRILGVRETDEGVIYEIVHEALINGWGTLRRWLDDEQESRALRHRIEAAAAEWERLQRPSNALWSAAQVDELKAVDLGTLRPREAAFLEACRRHVQRGRRIRRALVVAIPLALAGTYGGVRVQEYRALQARVAGHVETASAALEAGRGRVADVDRQQRAAYEKFDARAGEEGEALWAAALKVAGETDEQFKEAAREYETALMLDPGREDIRGMVGDVLLERALLAERVYAKSRVDEQLERLALYDPDGSRLRRWEAPGSLTLRTTPPGARVSIDRYEDDGRLLQLRDAPRDLGATPITSIELAQGSYVLRLELEGRHATTLPLRIGRDAASELEVALPERGAVPEGYIYIPAGRSMFGSSQEALRNTFHFAAPLHEVWTDAYIIARREVTFAEWIEFLEAQPPEERPKYGPNTEANGLMTRLSFEDGAWKLSIVRGGKEYAAVAGEPLVLSGREERRAQDWLKLPVSGISVANAAVYVQWVDASGRLPGARLCTGHEWERAARGADARIFPHGHALEPGEANIDVTYNREQTNFNADIGGSYAASRSPFGVDDLTGNVVELTTSSLEDGVTVARGGGFYLDSISAQIVNRQVLPEEFADSAIGLRVCASFPLKSRGA